ncbi:MAG: hypothetical protein ACREWG_10025 [Gammaproteobacteria bacterium]
MLVAHADRVFCTAKARIEVLSGEVLGHAKRLKAAGGVNAVPPSGLKALRIGTMARRSAMQAPGPWGSEIDLNHGERGGTTCYA